MVGQLTWALQTAAACCARSYCAGLAEYAAVELPRRWGTARLAPPEATAGLFMATAELPTVLVRVGADRAAGLKAAKKSLHAALLRQVRQVSFPVPGQTHCVAHLAHPALVTRMCAAVFQFGVEVPTFIHADR